MIEGRGWIRTGQPPHAVLIGSSRQALEQSGEVVAQCILVRVLRWEAIQVSAEASQCVQDRNDTVQLVRPTTPIAPFLKMKGVAVETVSWIQAKLYQRLSNCMRMQVRVRQPFPYEFS